MEPLPIVEHLDVIENGRPGGGTCRERLVGTLRFEGGEEALLHGVVVAVAGATHAGLNVMGGQQFAVGVGGVLSAAVGVVEQARGRPTGPHEPAGCRRSAGSGDG